MVTDLAYCEHRHTPTGDRTTDGASDMESLGSSGDAVYIWGP